MILASVELRFLLRFDCGRCEGIILVAVLNGPSDGTDDQIDGIVSPLAAIRDNLSSAHSVSDDNIERKRERERGTRRLA